MPRKFILTCHLALSVEGLRRGVETGDSGTS
jgi:hypothetical protein